MAITHSTVTTNPNNPAFPVSNNAWNQAHNIDPGTITDAMLATPEGTKVTTAQSTSAIQSVINGLTAATPTPLVFLPGTYNLTTDLTFNNFITLEIGAYGAIFTGGRLIIHGTSPSQSRKNIVKGGQFGNGSGIRIENSSDTSIYDSWLNSTTSIGVEMINNLSGQFTSLTSMYKCRFSNCGVQFSTPINGGSGTYEGTKMDGGFFEDSSQTTTFIEVQSGSTLLGGDWAGLLFDFKQNNSIGIDWNSTSFVSTPRVVAPLFEVIGSPTGISVLNMGNASGRAPYLISPIFSGNWTTTSSGSPSVTSSLYFNNNNNIGIPSVNGLYQSQNRGVPPNAVQNTYGAFTNIVAFNGNYITIPHIGYNVVAIGSETITFSFSFAYADGTLKQITKTVTSASPTPVFLTDNDLLSLLPGNNLPLTQVSVATQSTINSSTATPKISYYVGEGY